MFRKILTASLLASLAVPAFAAGDAAKGERDFTKCRACHSITDGDKVIQHGGRTGPNLFGVIGRQAGTATGFHYGTSIVEAGKKGLVWNAENLTEYLKDPRKFLQSYLDDPKARAKMTFRLTHGGEDVAAYLAQFSSGPAPQDDTAASTSN